MKSLLHSRAVGWKERTGELWGKIVRYANADLSRDAVALNEAARLPLALGGAVPCRAGTGLPDLAGGLLHAAKQAQNEQPDTRTLLRWLARDGNARLDGERIFSDHIGHCELKFETSGHRATDGALKIRRTVESLHLLDFICSFVLEHGQWQPSENLFSLRPQSCPVGVCARPACGKFFVRVTRKSSCTRTCTLLQLRRPREESTMYQYARRARQMTVGTLERKIKDIKKKKIEPARKRWQLKTLRKVLRKKKPS